MSGDLRIGWVDQSDESVEVVADGDVGARFNLGRAECVADVGVANEDIAVGDRDRRGIRLAGVTSHPSSVLTTRLHGEYRLP